MTFDESRRRCAEAIDTYGWAITTVEHDRPWAYTIGLLERFNHPELVIAGVGLDLAADILNGLGEEIRQGQRFEAGTHLLGGDGEVIRFVPVHEAQFGHGVFDSWFDQYRSLGPDVLELRALQVRLPDSYYCSCHAAAVPRLDTPRDVLGSRAPTQVATRAQPRGTRPARRPGPPKGRRPRNRRRRR